MSKPRKQKLPRWNLTLLAWLLGLWALVALLYFFAPGLFQVSESDYASKFAQSAASQGFVYYGDTRTKLYYPVESPKAKRIPDQYLVKFKSEEAAKKYGFRRGRS